MTQIDTESQLQAILGVLSQQSPARGMHHRVALCQQALTLINRDQDPTLWAALQSKLGNSLVQNSQGERSGNLECAIHHYEQALEVQTRETLAEQWAATQYNMATAYRERIRGERADNLEQAIHHYEQALQVYTRETFPRSWAMTQGSLALALSERIRGERADNLEQAIRHFEQALQIHTREALPADWAATQNNMALALSKRIRGQHADNLEQAIQRFEQALQIYTPEALPADWARTQYNLANIYFNRIRGERADNLEQAIHYYEQALKVRTRGAVPEQWATTQNNLATAYAKRIRGERADNLEQAIHHYQQALKVRTRQAFPNKWAETQSNLANAYVERIRGELADNLEQAVHQYQQALEICTREPFPEQWGGIQNNLATAYMDRLGGERANNLEQAIHHCEQALKVRTREAFPAAWATTQNNLATAYRERIRGERADNLKQAIHHYDQALEVRTREGVPEQWATTQNNLGTTYAKRIRGERANNLEQAIHHYQQALEVRTREAFPAEYRRTQCSLGGLHFNQQDWERAHASYVAAIEAGADLLAQAYTEAGRRAEVAETAQLYANDAYALLRLGHLSDALLTLEQGKARLLNEALALAEVDLTMLPAADQQTMWSSRRTVRELETEARLHTETSARLSYHQLAEALRKARADLNHLIESIRAEQPEFMPVGLDLPRLLALIPEGGALVAPLFTSKGSAVLVVPQGATTVEREHVIELQEFTDIDLRVLLLGPPKEPRELGGWLGAHANYRFAPTSCRLKHWFRAIETIGSELWKTLLGPVHALLKKFPIKEGAPVLLMPQGGLGLLPLHAAWRMVEGEKRYFLDDWTVSYAPSGYALSVSKNRLKEARRQEHRLLAIANPTSDLSFAAVEGKAVTALFADARPPLEEDKATLAAVKAGSPAANYLHFSCHGVYNWRDPMQSSLSLADGQLTLAKIISDLDISAARLITLSACETGVTEIQSPDEFLGLPAGFLQAGAPAVLSTLWPVDDDVSTMLLMERFYEKHLEGLAPPTALRRAQLWLRDITARELTERFAAEETARLAGGEPADLTGDQFLRFAARDPDDHPFAEAHYWAAFTLNGL